MSMKRRRAPSPPLTGTIVVPGDKSISHRAVLLAALAPGRATIRGCNLGADLRATLDGVAALGARVGVDEANHEVEVHGCGWTGRTEPADVIDAGNSATTLRLLLGGCASLDGLAVLTGDASLRARPMARVVGPLRRMGAAIDGRDGGDRAPLAVRGGPLEGIDVALPVASAQVKGALILAGLRAAGTTTIVEPGASRDHTERILGELGAPVEVDVDRITVRGSEWEPPVVDYEVPGDASAAAFFAVAAAVVDGSDLTIDDVGLNPGRTGFVDALRAMGAGIEVIAKDAPGGEPRGSIRVARSELRGVVLDGSEVPRLIDELPVLAVAATQAEGTTVVTGAAELRVKESDRIAALVSGLRALGADAEELPDGFKIEGPTPLDGGEVDARDDHRIAMAFAIAGLVARANVRVKGWSSVQTSFPEFLDVLGRARGRG